MVMTLRGALAGVAAIGGLLAVFAGSPYLGRHAEIDVRALASAVAHEDDHVTAVELAGWIRGKKQGLRVVDLQPDADFATYHIPTAQHVALESLPSTPFDATDTLVLYSGGGAHAAQAWVFLRALGYRRVYFLRGGVREWLDEVMSPTLEPDAGPAARAAFQRVASLSRYFGGVPRIGGVAAARSLVPDSGDASQPHSSPKPTPAEIRRRGC
jgi:rhodanese-related sulfurtransferase